MQTRERGIRNVYHIATASSEEHGTWTPVRQAIHASWGVMDVYVQTMEKSVLDAVDSRTDAVPDGWSAPVKEMGLQGGKPRARSQSGEARRSLN